MLSFIVDYHKIMRQVYLPIGTVLKDFEGFAICRRFSWIIWGRYSAIFGIIPTEVIHSPTNYVGAWFLLRNSPRPIYPIFIHGKSNSAFSNQVGFNPFHWGAIVSSDRCGGCADCSNWAAILCQRAIIISHLLRTDVIENLDWPLCGFYNWNL